MERRAQRGGDLALDVFLLDRGLDDEIQSARASMAGAGAMRRSGLPFAFADEFFATWRAMLPLMVAMPA
jgi:hypothetical protein